MSEKEIRIVPIKTIYVCDNCEIGEMVPNGIGIYLSNPPKYRHSCTNCGHSQTFVGKTYPIIEYKEVKGDN